MMRSTHKNSLILIALASLFVTFVTAKSSGPAPALSWNFKCRDGRTVPWGQVCDSIADCVDGSDENNFTICAPYRQCLPQEFTCSSGKCVSLVQICDQHDDCGDASDELGCNDHGRCESAGCQQRCISLSTGGYMCHCSPGFHLTLPNRQQCDDIDECVHMKLNHCPQKCHNMIGSFNCSCDPGYVQSEYKCLATGEPEVLIYANGPALLALHQGSFRYFIASNANITTMDVDAKENMIYWVNSNNFLIRSYIPGASRTSPPSGFEQVLAKTQTQVTSISIDWIARNLYWAELSTFNQKNQGIISVSTVDGRFKLPLVLMDEDIPVAIAVNPEIGWVYWACVGSSAHIAASWMDGSYHHIIANSSLVAPTGLAIDFRMRHRIYWSDAASGRIESANWDGSDRVVIAEGEHLGVPGRLDVFGLTLYWAPKNSSEVRRIDKFGRGVQVTVSKHAQPITDFKVFQTVKYNTDATNACASAGCSHLCLLTPVGAKCSCPEGALMQANSTVTCAAVTEPPRPEPFKCLCLNGGLCRVYSNGEVSCQCPNNFQGNLCEISVNSTG